MLQIHALPVFDSKQNTSYPNNYNFFESAQLITYFQMQIIEAFIDQFWWVGGYWLSEITRWFTVLGSQQYNTIQYNTIQYNTIQYNTIQYNTILGNAIQYKSLVIA